MKKHAGIYVIDGGYRAFVRVDGHLRAKRFKADATLIEMQRWRELQRVTAHYQIENPLPGQGESFSHDVNTYLRTVSGMPTFQDRQYRMAQWVIAFGHRSRSAITSVMIRAQLERWRKSGRIDGKPLSAGSLNLRRTALFHFYTVMEGPEGKNPVRGVPPYREDEPVLRLPTVDQAQRAILAVKHPRYPKKKGTVTQARLWVLLYTGWPSAILKRLTKADVRWDRDEVTVSGRQKGSGTKPRTVPLLPAARLALQRFDALNAYGTFSNSALHSALHRGCDLAKVRRFRVYDVRHLFITQIVAASGDERGASELALHSDPRQTRRYSRQAASTRAKAALEAARNFNR